MLESIRNQLHQLHLELPKNNLVTWTGGNISARDPESGYVAIKPSGVRYEDLRPEHMVILDLEGDIIEARALVDLTQTLDVGLAWRRGAARPVLVDPFLSVAREHPTVLKLSI